MRINSKFILIVILAVAAFLRIYKLGSIPPSLTPDEASLGYNAYSILKTGKDEHGQILPIIFKSFGDYKPGLYIYTAIPFVAAFGLNEFSVRLPSAVFGILSVYLIYELSLLLFKRKDISLLTAFFFAISPWHMFFSRGAWEINLSLALTLLGIIFFLKALKNQKYLLVSALFFSLTLSAYQGAKLSSSLVLALLVLCFYKDFFKISKKYLLGSVILGVITAFPVLLSLVDGKAGRLSVFSVFSTPRPDGYLKNILDQGGETKNSLNYYLFHSEWYNFVRGIMGRWFNHFSGRFLFFEGDFSNPRHSAPYAGMLTIADLPLMIIGFGSALRHKINREILFILSWLAVSPLPAILSRDQVHAVRSFNMVIPLTIVVSFGAFSLYKLFSRKKIVLVPLIIVYAFSYIYYLDAYFIHLPKLDSKYWEYGYKQVVNDITPVKDNYSKVIVQQSYAQPYIYFLFYNKYDPAKYQKEANANYVPSPYGDVGQVTKLDNIYFEGIDWQVLRGKSNTLIVGDTERIPEGDSKEGAEFHVLSDIKYLDGQNTAFRIIEIK